MFPSFELTSILDLLVDAQYSASMQMMIRIAWLLVLQNYPEIQGILVKKV